MKATYTNHSNEEQAQDSRAKTALLYLAAAIGGLLFAALIDFIDGGIHFTLHNYPG